MSVKLTSQNFDTETAVGVVAVDFYTDGCMPCKRIAPVLAELESDGAFKLAKINAENELTLSEKYNVTAAPTILFFKDGKEQTRIVGFANKDKLRGVIEAL
ncbi:MAG: thioredoxin family protein [Oscillospiraceae bacterium]|jgi:thioredoxin 1|nr:thioredoxin family protein [Oscillospiraceae bacterium]